MANQITHDPIALTIFGGNINSIADLYREINRAFMAQESWHIGESLDALNDLLYGGFGAVPASTPAIITWRDHQHTRAVLGVEATKFYYLAKLDRPDSYRAAWVAAKIAELESGAGATYFEMVEEIFANHPRFTLQWA